MVKVPCGRNFFFLLLKVIVLPDEPSVDTEGVSELTPQKMVLYSVKACIDSSVIHWQVVKIALRCPSGRTICRRFLKTWSSLVSLPDWSGLVWIEKMKRLCSCLIIISCFLTGWWRQGTTLLSTRCVLRTPGPSWSPLQTWAWRRPAFSQHSAECGGERAGHHLRALVFLNGAGYGYQCQCCDIMHQLTGLYSLHVA